MIGSNTEAESLSVELEKYVDKGAEKRRPNLTHFRRMTSTNGTGSKIAVTKNIVAEHEQYTRGTLEEHQLGNDPIQNFSRWLEQAIAEKVREPEAVCVSTATPQGVVSSRMVLLRKVDDKGFVFYTNYDSRKGQEIAQNPHASMCFYWREMERQVRIVGKVEKLTTAESDEYFQTRPLQSRIGAWASPQSQVIDNRDELDHRVEEFSKKFGVENPNVDDHRVPVPPYWGGIRLVPDEVEFWQGRDNRLHDRFTYRRTDGGEWKRDRLAP
ncbi:pyridoxine/pyridoxamine 5'-phosphate oxidase [Planoprotostelium fungivorum]|uniref:pyridoxal 5'-phosphate synthase n=1 Tax=Planoprotostelium fungivorum TaxID=1890364 RepID=A0A2P6NQQ3_9EUKA|nr:pyridoxine/pyridoxamine 5'-phosphate oxidase [Planoprotostelium fungivorum]